MSLGLPQWVVLAVAALRLIEIIHARRNAARLIADGGREVGAGHYPLFVLLHAGWLAALFIAVPGDADIVWPLVGVFSALQLGRLWVIATLGRYWTTRIITVEGAPLVRRGPFRFLRHPNYAIVACEIAVLPLAFGAWWIAGAFTILNAALLTHRIRIENAALQERRTAT
ncbi:MAG: isoprenylcysteine carboxyl methyltransferase family protein [Alphaproteobacteria bacterium]